VIYQLKVKIQIEYNKMVIIYYIYVSPMYNLEKDMYYVTINGSMIITKLNYAYNSGN